MESVEWVLEVPQALLEAPQAQSVVPWVEEEVS